MKVSFKHSRGLGFTLQHSHLFATNTDLTGCRFTEAILRGADLRSSVLDGHNLIGVNPYDANQGGTDLRGSSLGPYDLDRLRKLKRAILTIKQARSIVTNLTGAVLLD